MKYFWIRIYNYNFEEEQALKESEGFNEWLSDGKGILLNEFYLKGKDLSREDTKIILKEKHKIERFAKPRKQTSGVYAIVMDSNEFFFNNFYLTLDTLCSYCGKPIKGKLKDFPKKESYYDDQGNYQTYEEKEIKYFCKYDCRRSYDCFNKLEGLYQEKKSFNDRIVGYVYCIYNRIENKYYIGQTQYPPFWRWQEHVSMGDKGFLCDMIFSVITQVNGSNRQDLYDAESWWIQKYISDYGKDKVFNINMGKTNLPFDYDNVIDTNIHIKEGE